MKFELEEILIELSVWDLRIFSNNWERRRATQSSNRGTLIDLSKLSRVFEINRPTWTLKSESTKLTSLGNELGSKKSILYSSQFWVSLSGTTTELISPSGLEILRFWKDRTLHILQIRHWTNLKWNCVTHSWPNHTQSFTFFRLDKVKNICWKNRIGDAS